MIYCTVQFAVTQSPVRRENCSNSSPCPVRVVQYILLFDVLSFIGCQSLHSQPIVIFLHTLLLHSHTLLSSQLEPLRRGLCSGEFELIQYHNMISMATLYPATYDHMIHNTVLCMIQEMHMKLVPYLTLDDLTSDRECMHCMIHGHRKGHRGHGNYTVALSTGASV